MSFKSMSVFLNYDTRYYTTNVNLVEFLFNVGDILQRRQVGVQDL